MNPGQLTIDQAPFLFLSSHPDDYFRKLSKGNTSNNDDQIFKTAFLSTQNMAYINNGIKRKVYENTIDKYIVPDQKVEHLHLVMEQIYDKNPVKNHDKNDINKLNNITIDFCSKTIIKEINHKVKYLKIFYAKPTTMPEPVNCSIKGLKTTTSRISFDQQPFDVNKKIKNVDVYSRTILVDDEGIEKYCNDF